MLPKPPGPTGRPAPQPGAPIPAGPAPSGASQANPVQAKAAMIEALKVIRQVAKENGLNFDELVATSAQPGATPAGGPPAPTRAPRPAPGRPAPPVGGERPPSLPIG